MFNLKICYIVIFVLNFENCFTLEPVELNRKKFPVEFLFGVASAAYQVEGSWNTDGRGISIWDHLMHTNPNFTKDGKNGDVACDFYHKYKEDIATLKELGVDHFRLSISWPRILPNGTGLVNRAGITFYRSVIEELLRNGIIPMVTIYHLDLPQPLQDRGGFLNPEFADWFEGYARILFDELGDLVQIWTTINEPSILCLNGYAIGDHAPALTGDGTYNYICGHNALKGHARVYRLYDKEYRQTQNGIVGMIFASTWYEPGSNNTEDIAAAKTALEFTTGWFAHPIFVGDYPDVMKSQIANRSLREGRSDSRLPKFTQAEIDEIRGTHDYFGLNHYTSLMAFAQDEAPIRDTPGQSLDMNVNVTAMGDEWKAACVEIFKVFPLGLRKLLGYIKENYNNTPIYITENGVCDFGGQDAIDDEDRVAYMQQYLSAVRDAMDQDRADVRAYTAWSYMDSFEWTSGYRPKFGIYNVDFNDPQLPRRPKKSAVAYKAIMATHCLVDICEEE